MDTPIYSHLTSKEFDHIYEPAEDSFFLLDALEFDLKFLEEIKPNVCLEIGSGSGIIITALSKKFPASICLATDINPHACRATRATAKLNQSANVDALHCNLLDALRPNTIDVLIFNPPYVPTTDPEYKEQRFGDVEWNSASVNDTLFQSWAGGVNGRRVIDELLPKLDSILSPVGVFYLLVLRENKPEELIAQLYHLGFNAFKFMERRIPGEYLYILKVIRRR